MNRPAMVIPQFLRAALFALVLPLALGACDSGKAPLDAAPLAGAAIGGDFTLVGKDGKDVHWSDFKGQWRIVYFGYTFCPDVCPVDAAAIGQGLRAFEKNHSELGKQVTPLFITVDPTRDTPEVVGEFAAAFHPRLVGLTGTTEEVAAAAKKFAVWFQKGEETANGGYLVNHTNQTYLFDPDGKPVALLPTDKGGPAVAAELARWVH